VFVTWNHWWPGQPVATIVCTALILALRLAGIRLKLSLPVLREDLYEVLGTQRLDLVDLDRASPLLRFHIVRDGDLLYARDTDALNRFELATLHLYRDTAPLGRRHREILKERMNAWS
jgi:hypothetical protein